MWHQILKAMLFISTSLLSVGVQCLMFVIMTVLPSQEMYYDCSQLAVIFLVCCFSLPHIICAPLLLDILKNKPVETLKTSVIVLSLGCIARYIFMKEYIVTVLLTLLIGTTTTVFSLFSTQLLKTTETKMHKFISMLTTLLSTLMIGLTLLYCQYWMGVEDYYLALIIHIENINKIITIVLLVFAAISLILINKFKESIEEVENSLPTKNEMLAFAKNMEKGQNKYSSNYLTFIIVWGIVLGLGWTYRISFRIYIESANLNRNQIIQAALLGNVFCSFFSNSHIFNSPSPKNKDIIFMMQCVGLLALLIVQTCFFIPNEFAESVCLTISTIVMMDALNGFRGLAIGYLSKYPYASITPHLIEYVSKTSHIVSLFIMPLLSNEICMLLLAGVVWICIWLTHLREGTQQDIWAKGEISQQRDSQGNDDVEGNEGEILSKDENCLLKGEERREFEMKNDGKM